MRTSIPLDKILVSKSNYQTNKLRKRLIKSKIKEHCCEHCGNVMWQGEPIPLELSHKNGLNDDHRLENLEILCPNCHALTDTYRGKNWGKAQNRHYYAHVAQLEGGI